MELKMPNGFEKPLRFEDGDQIFRGRFDVGRAKFKDLGDGSFVTTVRILNDESIKNIKVFGSFDERYSEAVNVEGLVLVRSNEPNVEIRDIGYSYFPARSIDPIKFARDISKSEAEKPTASLSGDDVITAASQNDFIFSSAGNDTIKGGDGRDTIQGGEGNDSLQGQADNDSIEGGTGNDVLSGAGGSDTLFGDEGADTLTGGQNNDFLTGGDGADVLIGGQGNDFLTGGNGADVFEFSLRNRKDTISDFEVGTDTLALDDRLWREDLTVDELIDEYARYTSSGVVFDFGKNEILIEGVFNPVSLSDDIVII